jgi:hypothetical protein
VCHTAIAAPQVDQPLDITQYAQDAVRQGQRGCLRITVLGSTSAKPFALGIRAAVRLDVAQVKALVKPGPSLAQVLEERRARVGARTPAPRQGNRGAAAWVAVCARARM